MRDETQALLFLLGAGVLFFAASRLLAKPSVKGLQKAQRIACLGDSITASGYYCGDVAAKLQVTAKAFGYPGQGTQVVGSHVEDVLAWMPDAVIVLAGVNDLPSPDGDQKAIEGLSAIYQQLRAAKKLVVAVEILPWHGYPSAKGNEYKTYVVNQWIRSEAKVDAVVRTGDMGDENGRLLSTFDDGAGLHPNRLGQATLAALIVKQAFGG